MNLGESTTHTFYFAYGSNMSVPRLQARMPSARFYCSAVLPGYQLRFHKKGADGSAKCDVVETGMPGHEVHGVVFEFDLRHKPILDRYEGPRYRDKRVPVKTATGESLEVFLYEVGDKQAYTDPRLQPFDWYKQHVLQGARAAKLPEDYIQESILSVSTREDPDPKRERRELSIYPPDP
ncbi:MAG: gamma-glutamylcyclotransferase family protein [Pseudomonadota bacterium]|nr:gamma-glutamylcyclotransferase family protein [Pseudomonadota bacterium]